MNNLTFIACNKPYKEAKIVIFGAPFDGTVSYRPGTRFAPNAIRIDSANMESYSPALDLDLDHQAVTDIGDLEMTYGNKEKTLDTIYTGTKKILEDGKIPFMIGGEHLVSLPAVKAVYEKYPNLKLIHIDAHTDLRDTFFGEALSHATVLKKIHAFLGDGNIYQFGIRSGLKEEFEFAKNHLYIEPFTLDTLPKIAQTLGQNPVYITLDLDVLDPSVMMGTGTPEAGGVSYKELIQAIYALNQCNIVGLDVVELAPHYDTSGVSTAIASKIIRELLLTVNKK